MKKNVAKLVLAMTLGLGGVVALSQPVTASASSKFTGIPTTYLKSAKAQYAFHWQKVTVGKKTGTFLIFGNFKTSGVSYAIPTKYKLSKTHRTLTTYYKLLNNKGKVGKATYRMDLYKYSNAHYRVKLNNYKAGLLPSYKGKAYTFTSVKTSPAKTYANKYTKPGLTSAYTTALTNYVQEQYKDGKTSIDPSTADAKAQIKTEVDKQVNTTLTSLINSFNYQK